MYEAENVIIEPVGTIITEYQMDLGDLGWHEVTVYGDITRHSKTFIECDIESIELSFRGTKSLIYADLIDPEILQSITIRLENHLEDIERNES